MDIKESAPAASGPETGEASPAQSFPIRAVVSEPIVMTAELSDEDLVQAGLEIQKIVKERAEYLRDPKGRFKAKPPITREGTWPHFWLEVCEIAVGVYLFQLVWEGTLWATRLLVGQ